MPFQRCPYESCGTNLWEEEEKGQEIVPFQCHCEGWGWCNWWREAWDKCTMELTVKICTQIECLSSTLIIIITWSFVLWSVKPCTRVMESPLHLLSISMWDTKKAGPGDLRTQGLGTQGPMAPRTRCLKTLELEIRGPKVRELRTQSPGGCVEFCERTVTTTHLCQCYKSKLMAMLQ